MSLFHFGSGQSAPPTNSISTDVCVAGAGPAGLACARLLLKAGLSVVVLEGRSRIGGRTKTEPLGKGHVDVGAQWICKSQEHINSLLKELGLEDQKREQKWFTDIKASPEDALVRSGSENALTANERERLKEIARYIQRLSDELPEKTHPEYHEILQEHDSKSFEAFMADHLESKKLSETETQNIRKELRQFICNTFACEPNQVSFLFVLECIKSCGSLYLLADGEDGAQEYTLRCGLGRVVEMLGEKIQERSYGANEAVLTRSNVSRITAGKEEVTVVASNVTVTCRWAVVAFAPTLWNRISFEPELPPQKMALTSGMSMGHVIKVFAVYDEDFWTGRKTSERLLEDLGPVFNLFPAEVGGDPALVGLITASRAADLAYENNDKIMALVLRQYYEFFGQDIRAYRPTYFKSKSWGGDKYSGGCYEAVPRVDCAANLTEHGPEIHAGRIGFACTEMATKWIGFVDGAIEAGERAAREAIEHLQQ